MRTFANEATALEYLLKEVPWGNAAGSGKDAKTMMQYAQASMPHVTFGSIMPHPWDGNPGDNFNYNEVTGNAINALGIPDKGIDAHMDDGLSDLRQKVNGKGSQFWVSVSGRANNPYNPRDYCDMANILQITQSADGVEGNFSCGNQESGGKRKSVVCFDPPLYREGVAALKEGAGTLKTKVKIAPITDPGLLEQLVQPCIDYGIDYVVYANTQANCYITNKQGKPAIPMIRGGLSGRGLRPLICGGILTIAPMIIDTGLKLIAVGGIESGRDAYEYLTLGAHGFAFNTVLTRNSYNPDVVEPMFFGNQDEGKAGLVNFLVMNGLPD